MECKWPERKEPKLFNTPRADGLAQFPHTVINFCKNEFEKKEIVNDIYKCEGWNACHDAFMKVINEKPPLEELNSDDLHRIVYEYVSYEEVAEALASDILMKFGAEKGNMDWLYKIPRYVRKEAMENKEIEELADIIRKVEIPSIKGNYFNAGMIAGLILNAGYRKPAEQIHTPHFISGMELCTKDSPCPICKPVEACEHDFNYHTLKQPCSNCNVVPEPQQEKELLPTSNEGWAIIKDSTGEICGHGMRAYEVFLNKKDADKENTYPSHGYKGYSVKKVYISSQPSKCGLDEKEVSKAMWKIQIDWMNYDRTANIQQHSVRISKEDFYAKAICSTFSPKSPSVEDIIDCLVHHKMVSFEYSDRRKCATAIKALIDKNK